MARLLCGAAVLATPLHRYYWATMWYRRILSHIARGDCSRTTVLEPSITVASALAELVADVGANTEMRSNIPS
jgi:hypothetical protein